MGAKEIMAKKFEMALRGYKTEEVEEFLKEVSLDFSRLQKENEDLEKKLGVLADKIREYREDEDTLKDALLGAQRQGNALIADSKRKSAEIIEETQNKIDAMLKKAENDRQKLNEKGEAEIKAAEERAAQIIAAANKKAKEIENEMNLKTNVQKEILHRTTSEISAFKTRIVNAYKEHIESIEKVAGKCENEFIRTTMKEGRPNLKLASEGASEAAVKPAPKVRKAKTKTQQLDQTAEVAAPVADKPSKAEETAEIAIPAAAAVDETIKFEVDVPAFESEVAEVAHDVGDTNDLFYKKRPDTRPKNSGERTKQLQFGGNNTTEIEETEDED